MKLHSEVELRYFDAWSGAKDTKNRILEARLDKEFDALIEEIYPDGIDETQLNDILWFESDWVYESLGMVVD
jgi:hypothetical protein